LFLLIPFVTKTFSQPPDPSQIPEPQIAYALHATWDPDLTDNNPSVCTNSGTVAVPWFHFYAGWKGGAPAFFSVDWVLIEELTNEHQPQVWYFKNPQGSSGFPYGCTMPPVSDPQNWNWTTWSFAPMIGFAMHNTAYRVTVQWRYGVYMKGPRGPFQTSITINVQNLVVTSPDVGRVLRWDPERGIADTSFSYNIECAQKKQVQVKVRIYGMNRNLVYELTEQKICPGSYSFTWDGTVNTGYYEYPPDEWSNIAPAGLYTFDVEVIANPYDRDAVRSQALSVDSIIGRLYYDDKGTEDESDDEEFLVVEYVLKSDRNASSGEIWLYDPDLNRIGRWDIYGLTASPTGIQHTIFIPISLSLFTKEGIYWIVPLFKDNHIDRYRNHRVKTVISGYFGICETYYSGEVDGQVVYFKYLWPEELEEELTPLTSSEIPPGAEKCPECEGSGRPGVVCNGVHTIENWLWIRKRVYLCRICNALGYTAKTWPKNKLSLNPPKTTEPDTRKIPRKIRDQVNALANQIIDEKTRKKRGCHSCGAQTPGTEDGDWIPDHFPAVKLARAEFEILGGIIISIRLVPDWYLLPHCINCSRRQGGNIRSIKRWVKNETKECTLSHSGSGGGGSW
jgi:hypothetical protein